MSSLNEVTLIGNVGADPEIRAMQNGNRVANVRIATSESWKDRATGERKEKTEWHTVTVWSDGLVGVVERFVKKGSKIYVKGQLQTRKWADKDGNDRHSTEVVLQGFDAKLILLDGRPEGGQQSTGQSTHNQQKSNGYQPQRELDDDVPF